MKKKGFYQIFENTFFKLYVIKLWNEKKESASNMDKTKGTRIADKYKNTRFANIL